MIKKFLAFIGLSSVKLEDGKANITMTEEQMEASGKVIADKEDAVASVTQLAKDLEEEKQQNVAAQTKLTDALKEIATQKIEIERLKGLGGAASLETIDATDGKGEADGLVVDDSKTFEENWDACGKGFGFIEK